MSSSSSSSIRRRRHEVFLNFRGKDTRQNFVGHLYNALELKGIQTFRDDEGLRKGSSIGPALYREIEEARIAVTVFSKNYCDSPWCLNELVKIMNCRQENGLLVYPVFYDVSPSDVRNLAGDFGEGFKKLEETEMSSLLLEVWRRTLQEIGFLAGWDLTNPIGSHQASCITSIVETAISDLDYATDCIDQSLIGIDHRMRNMMPLNSASERDVGIIGILGLPDSGKTTVARAVFNDMREQFDGNCFLHNISEVSKKQGLVFLQKKLLSGVLRNKKMQVSDIYEGCNKIKKWLGKKKVLIVLDKVDSAEQLEALAGARDWFGDRSRIIITTTNKQLIHKLIDCTHNVILLNDEEAMQLLNQCAFQNGIPTTEAHKEYLDRLIHYAGGHPGALKRLGSKLIGKSIEEWVDTIDSLATCPEVGTDKRIKSSLEGLNTHEMELFLDIACFFNGWLKDEVSDILDCCGLFPTCGLTTLEKKSLVSFTRGFIHMHNLVVETGRNIVRQEHPDEPSRQSRLWHPLDVKDVLMENKGTEFIKAIVMSNINKLDARAAFDAFTGMRKLRLLHAGTQKRVYGSSCHPVQWTMEGSGCLKFLPCDLKWLTWDHYDLESWPVDFHAGKLVGLQMRYSGIRALSSGRDMQFMSKLKFLDLSFSKDLIRTPNFDRLPLLKKLNLEHCSSLVEVHPSIRYHGNLAHLNLGSCTKLESLPRSLEMRSLEVLNLSWCSKLTKIPDFVGMEKLRELDLSHNSIRELPPSIGYLRSLTYLDIGNCRNLTSIPLSIRMLDYQAQILHYGCPVW